MKSATIKILDRAFGTQDEAKAFVRHLLNAEMHNRLCPGSASFAVLADLIRRHPEREEKVGAGVAAFLVHPNPLKPDAPAFHIERVDGTTIDISWIKCVSGKPKTPFQNLQQAMRREIKDQIQEFRTRTPIDACTLCGDGITHDTSHVDHIEPFLKLVEAFLVGRDAPTVFDDDPFCFVATFRQQDAGFAEAWREYHRENASLRYTCIQCNLRRKRVDLRRDIEAATGKKVSEEDVAREVYELGAEAMVKSAENKNGGSR